jgi:hypothetical protein
VAAEPRYPIFGVDVAEVDTSVVVMHRGDDGTWRVESADGPDSAEIAGMVGAAVERHRPAPAPAALREPVAWGELVAEWLTKHIEEPFELTADQRHMIQTFFDGGGRLRWSPQVGLHLANARTGS